MNTNETNILNLQNISITLGARKVLDDVSFGMSAHDKIGVIGVNGTGKSTLLGIAAGMLEPDEGEVIRGRTVQISCLTQNPRFDGGTSVLVNIAARVRGKADHWDTEGEVRAMLQKFGIDDPDVSPDTLSGGQKKRAALVAAILTPADLLILDEPTNHLDAEMIEWLEEFLISFRGAILMVTHDRYFLDEVTDQILEIDRGKIWRYDANYAGFLELKQQRLDSAAASERKMASLYRKDLAWMQRGARARSTKQKAHIQRFEALRDRDKIVEDRQVELSSLSSRLGGKTVEIDHLGKGYGGRVLFRDFSYIFQRTDRVGIIGPNGCGKSTLLKIICGLVKPDTGRVEIGETVKIGYFSQENEALDESQRVIDYVRGAAEYIRTADGLVSAADMCDRFLFPPSMQYTPISKLSGGEKRRLYLLRILMGAPNFLILDEPTNDLDIGTLRVLEDYLDHFAGIVLTVSHDRYFLDRVVTRIFAFMPDGALWQSEGAYEEYREHRLAAEEAGPDKTADAAEGRRRSGAEKGQGKSTDGSGADGKEMKEAAQDGTVSGTAAPETGNGGGDGTRRQHRQKLSYRDQKEYDAIEGEIDCLETEEKDLDRQILEAASDYQKLADLTARKEAVEAKLEERMERYLVLQDMVDALSKES
ncbi:MAG: ABC-F family ATP-binding cassette domain-containing protein [Lachnospiraceae bacterium]|nr:ABC-F family ATP-binding cassette domain-containing protein [Lachnospiraceae bacterium]MDY6333832.1 ABC-F family ATP-binding cassette domain-containing protein [Lachnospiraceae bacterium]